MNPTPEFLGYNNSVNPSGVSGAISTKRRTHCLPQPTVPVCITEAQKGAAYLQSYVSHRRDRWEEMERVAQADKAANAFAAAHVVSDQAKLLSMVGGDLFQGSTIPGNFASGNDFLEKVGEFDHRLERGETNLSKFVATTGMAQPNLRMVLQEVSDMRSAVAHVLSTVLPTGTPAPTKPSTAETLERIATRFPFVAQRMRKRHGTKPPILMIDEYDVQYVFLSILDVHFEDVRPEEAGCSVAGGGQRADCYLPEDGMVVEFKRVRKNHTTALLRAEVADDFVLYGKEPRFKNLFIFIYDPDRLLNKAVFENSLTDVVTGLQSVRVFVCQ